jgi:hypothetical protein
VKERPILFSAEMVRAILDGSKTQTRRIVKDSPRHGVSVLGDGCGVLWDSCPYGKPGDGLWVKETHLVIPGEDGIAEVVHYRADMTDAQIAEDKAILRKWGPADYPWKPSIFMTRDRSRITLEIVAVRVERLQDITGSECLKEGMPDPRGATIGEAKDWYRDLWELINGVGSWAENPFVWVVEFKRVADIADRQSKGSEGTKP